MQAWQGRAEPLYLVHGLPSLCMVFARGSSWTGGGGLCCRESIPKQSAQSVHHGAEGPLAALPGPC